MSERFVVMGAGEVGFHLARTLSQQGHSVVVVETDPAKQDELAELDVGFVHGNGALVPVLESARVDQCALFMAVSSSDEANLAAALLAKSLGAQRAVVRVGVAEDVTVHRRLYEDIFSVDMLLSTQLLATTKILNHILGHNTLAVEYLAKGKVQLRRIDLEKDSILTRKALREVNLPEDSLVVAFFRGDQLIIPSGDDQAKENDDALILCGSAVTDRVERLLNPRRHYRGEVVIAGGGATALTVARALGEQVDKVRIIEKDRRRAEQLAAISSKFEVLHGDATDLSLLKAERCARARAFVALTGQDERNLMACLLAQELGVDQVIALVDRTETSHLWQKLGKMHVVSPRRIAARRIREYIDSEYSANIVSLNRGKAQVLERRLARASPAAGVTLADMKPPRGLIVGAVARGDRVFVPRGPDRLEVGDLVILFVQEEHIPTVNLFFPGKDSGHKHRPLG